MTFLNRHRSRIRPVGPFAPSSLFFGGIPGAWYDPTDLSTMFQDNTGLTPVTAVEQPVGLIFDKSQGTPVARYNLLTYSEQFENAAWTKSGLNTTGTPPWVNVTTAPDGTMTADQFIENAAFIQPQSNQSISITAGGTYTFSAYAKPTGGAKRWVSLYPQGSGIAAYAVFDIDAGTVTLTGGASYLNSSIVSAGNGWYRCAVTFTAATPTVVPVIYISNAANQPAPSYFGNGSSGAFIWGAQLQTGSTATTYQRITTGTGGEWTPGNHASQSTAASRPTYRARYNLLTYSEQFNDASWTKLNATISANAAVAPDGTTTADKLIGTTAVASHWTGTAATIVNATSHTVSIYAKAGEYSQILMYDVNVNTYVAVDLSNGAVTSATASTYSVTPAGNGWYRISITAVSSSTSGTCRVYLWNGSTTVFAGDGTSGILIWGAQLLTAADVTATGNAYQRIAASTVYDTAPVFRPYLAFDGMDDSLSTAAINFTATDKMTVFAGQSKLQDASIGTVAELSADATANNGSFWLFAPYPPIKYSSRSRGTAVATANSSDPADSAPVTSVISAIMNISAPINQLRVNTSVRATDTSSQGTGNFGTWPLFIGRRNNASLPFNGRLFSLIVRGAASSVTEIADTELWVNAKTGAF